MTSAYAAVAAGAYPVKPWGVAGLDAKPADGGRPPRDAGAWRLANADRMRDLLSAVVTSGSGRGARLPIPAFGKTGTSQDYRDAWFIGFAGNLVVGVWVGNDDDTPMKKVTGGSLPAEIWRSFMQKAMKRDRDFKRGLPKVAAFEARDRELPDHSTAVAGLQGLAVRARPQARVTARYGQVLTGGFFDYGPPRVERRMEPFEGRPGHEPSSGAVSRGFQERLGDMGWPGQ
jgi:membrane peptidoglycan carboxypeptidase